MNKVYFIFTEINGYRNFYGHFAYSNKYHAESVAESVKASGRYDDVFVIGLWLD